MAKLVVLSAGMTGRTHELKVDKTTIGRVEDNTFEIADSSVSSHHCVVLLKGSDVLVRDLNSTNGTFINDKRIAYGRAFPISNADRVKFGNIEVTFEYIPRAVEEYSNQEVTVNVLPQEAFSQSQRDIQTVAFNSDEDVSMKTEYVPQPPVKAENIQPKENLQETRFVQVKPEAKPEMKEKAETNSSLTEDRINYDFSNED